jgi:predicted PurR-regulated permease PerM
VLIIGVLICASLWTLLPFIGSLVWATAIVIATWPLLLWVQRHVGGSRAIATTIMTVFMLLIFIVPFWVAVGALLEGAAEGVDVMRSYLKDGLGAPPAWIESVPFAGKRLANEWQALSDGGPAAFAEAVRPYARSVASYMVAVTGGMGGMFLHFLLTVILSAVLYATGETAEKGVIAFARRVGDEHGAEAVILAGKSVQGVALGVVVTALIQTALVGLGLWVCGVPHPGLLTAITFVLCIAQIGPVPLLILAIIWMYGHASAGWSTALLIWSIPVGFMDNFLRPILISKGVELPLLLIIAGVIGGIVGFGVIGLFVGPVILAVTYASIGAWIADKPAAA